MSLVERCGCVPVGQYRGAGGARSWQVSISVTSLWMRQVLRLIPQKIVLRMRVIPAEDTNVAANNDAHWHIGQLLCDA